MSKLVIPPNSEGYTAQDGTELLSVQLDGGLPRVRRDLLGAAVRVHLGWTVSAAHYRYLRAFYNIYINDAQPFLIDLLFNEMNLKEYQALFVPGSFKLTGQAGLTYTVEADIDVKPEPLDYTLERAYIDQALIYGIDSSQAATALANLNKKKTKGVFGSAVIT